jgi:hypothetical protein
MEVSGQLHTFALYSPDPLDRRTSSPQNRSGRGDEEKNYEMTFVAFPATEYVFSRVIRTRTEMVFETLVSSPLNHLTRLIARENFTIQEKNSPHFPRRELNPDRPACSLVTILAIPGMTPFILDVN